MTLLSIVKTQPNDDQDHVYEILSPANKSQSNQLQEETPADAVYSVVGPETDSGCKAAEAEYMHYEMVC